MKGTFLAVAAAGFLAAAFATPASAQDAQKEAMQKKYEEKIAEAWFKDGGWTDDYDAALAKSKETGKPILAYFSRSYSP